MSKRSLYRVFTCVALSAILLQSEAYAACEKVNLRSSNASLLPTYEWILTSGSYCLNETARQSGIWNWHFKTRIISEIAFMVIWVADVDLSMAGNRIRSQGVRRDGVVAKRYRKVEPSSLSNIRISGGTIDVSEDAIAVSIPGDAPAIAVVEDFNDRLSRFRFDPLNEYAEGRREFVRQGAPIADTLVNHSNSINDTTLIADGLTALVFGRDTRITNNRIEVTDGRAGLYLRGASPVIENNIFIFRGVGRTATAAPIKLFQTDGAIIRNNIIIIEDAHWAPEQAISLIASAGVTVENNRVYGGKELVRVFEEGTDFSATGNTLHAYADRPALRPGDRAASDVDLTVRHADRFPFELEQETKNY